MAIVGNRMYNNPSIGQAIGSLAQLFAPPSPQDMTAAATTAATREKAQRLADFYNQSQDPNTSWETLDRSGVGVGAFAPNQSFRSVDIDAATKRGNNAADNTRALQQTGLEQSGAMEREKLKPFTVNEDQTFYASPEAQAAFGAPSQGVGVVKTQPGERATLPDGRVLEGAAKPLSETEWKAQEAERLRAGGQLSDADLKNTIMGGTPVESIVGPDGKPRIAYRPDAVGQQPAPKEPGTVVNLGPNGEPLGNPGEGLVWQRGADGKVVMDDRGAPIAIPFQGGKVFQAQQATEKQNATRGTTVQRTADVVTQDIDRALGLVGSSTLPTTGFVGDKLSGVPGTNARDIRALVDTVKANVGFDKLQAMREASPTGGALGQVSDTENRMLQATLGNLEQSQSEEQFVDNMKRLKNIYLDIVHGPGNGPPREELSFQQGQPGAAPAAPAAATPASPQGAPAPGTVQMGYRFNGGDPSNAKNWTPVQ